MSPISLASRLAVLLLLVLAASTSADAQARFVNACIASAAPDMPFDPDQVCGCAASASMRAGVTPADLDRLMDHVSESKDIDIGSLPPNMRPIAETTVGALLNCALAQDPTAAAGTSEATIARVASAINAPAPIAIAPAAALASGTVPTGGAVGAPTGTASAASPGLPAGLRTGNGTGTFRTSSPSPGGVIRILE